MNSLRFGLSLAAIAFLSGCIIDTHVYVSKSLCEKKADAQLLVGKYVLDLPKSDNNSQKLTDNEEAPGQIQVELSKTKAGQLKAVLLNPEFEEVRTASGPCKKDSIACAIESFTQASVKFIEGQAFQVCSNQSVNGLLLEFKDKKNSGAFGYALAKRTQDQKLSIQFWLPDLKALKQAKTKVSIFNGNTKKRWLTSWDSITIDKNWFEEEANQAKSIIIDGSKITAKKLFTDFMFKSKESPQESDSSALERAQFKLISIQ